MTGKVLGGRYELLEEIGKGGMAYVYKAKCILLNRIVAVKILRDDLDGDEEFLKRFNAEAQAAAILAHSNIVSIFDVGVDGNLHYIIMECVDGKTLKEYILEKGRLDYKEALDIAYQISDALSAAHAKNIVHRDIKPHNILITADGKIKVTDFGIARFGTGKTLSTGNDILGSVHYISPEQAKGMPVDDRSDIYSLGVVMYEMLSGKLPFEGDNPVSIAMMQIESNPEELVNSVPDLPISVQHIVFRAISKEPGLRYQTSAEMGEDIKKVLDDPDVIIDKRFLYDFQQYEQQLEKSEEQYNNVTRKSTKIILVACAAITSIAIVAAGYFVTNNNAAQTLGKMFADNQKEIKIPDFAGKSVEDAKNECRELGLTLLVEDEIEDDSKEPGTVISQEPEKGEEIKKGDMVKVVITKEITLFELENYAGKDYNDIEQALTDADIKVNVIFEDSQKEKGIILRQSPESGKKLRPGGEITLYVSGGIDMTQSYISVPNLVGKTYAEAKTLLESLGLKLGTTSGSMNPESGDKVVSQAIPAGSMVKKACPVSITVEKTVVADDTTDESSDSAAGGSEETDNAENAEKADNSNSTVSDEDAVQ